MEGGVGVDSDKEHFCELSQWNALIFLLPLQHSATSCVLRTLQGCLASCTLFNVCIWHTSWGRVIAVQAARMDLVGADVPPPAPGTPIQQLLLLRPALGKQERNKGSGLGLGLGLAQVLAWDTCPETPELPCSPSRHPPECTSINQLGFATKTSQPKPRHARQALGGSVAALPCAVF